MLLPRSTAECLCFPAVSTARPRGFEPLTFGSADRALLLDGLIGALAVAAVAAAVLLGPITDATGQSGVAVATGLAYPLGDLHMAALVVMVFAHTRWHPGPGWLLLGAGFLVAAVADSVFLYQVANGTYEQGAAYAGLWPIMGLLLAGSAWVRASHPVPAPRRSVASLIAPLSFTFVALGLLVYGRSW